MTLIQLNSLSIRRENYLMEPSRIEHLQRIFRVQFFFPFLIEFIHRDRIQQLSHFILITITPCKVLRKLLLKNSRAS